jgi:hypothetical protein
VPEDHKRVLRVAHRASQFYFNDLIEDTYRLPDIQSHAASHSSMEVTRSRAPNLSDRFLRVD